jgi:hypothetical protein
LHGFALGKVLLMGLACIVAQSAVAARKPVLAQIDLPHNYYYREMYLPQLTTGPSALTFSPDGKELIYSMSGSLWRQTIGSTEARELTHAKGYDYQPDWSPTAATSCSSAISTMRSNCGNSTCRAAKRLR